MGDHTAGQHHIASIPALEHGKEMHVNVFNFTGKYLRKSGGIHDLTFEALLSPVYSLSFIWCFV